MENPENSSWFNLGDEEAESYGVKIVEDVSMYLIDGEISDGEQDINDFKDNSLNLNFEKDFNEVKQFKKL